MIIDVFINWIFGVMTSVVTCYEFAKILASAIWRKKR